MDTSEKNPHNPDAAHGSIITYSVGFILSVMLTAEAFLAVSKRIFAGGQLVAFVTALAVAQLLVQLIFFLHLGRESKPRWNLTVFLFMLLVLGIVVIGSLWIMHNLNYNMMPHEVDQYIHQEEGI